MWDPEFGGSRSGTGPELLNFAGPGQVPGPEFSNLAGPGKVPGPEIWNLSGPGSNFKAIFLTKHDFFIIYSYLKLTKCILCIKCKIIKKIGTRKNFFAGPGPWRVPTSRVRVGCGSRDPHGPGRTRDPRRVPTQLCTQLWANIGKTDNYEFHLNIYGAT